MNNARLEEMKAYFEQFRYYRNAANNRGKLFCQVAAETMKAKLFVDSEDEEITMQFFGPWARKEAHDALEKLQKYGVNPPEEDSICELIEPFEEEDGTKTWLVCFKPPQWVIPWWTGPVEGMYADLSRLERAMGFHSRCNLPSLKIIT